MVNTSPAEQPSEDERLSQIFAALSDTTRRDLVTRLATGDASVGELAEPYQMSVQAISKHVAILESSTLVSKQKNGRTRTIHLEAEVFDLMTKWIERYRQQAEERYIRLDSLLVEMNNRSNPATTNQTPNEEQSA